MPERATRSVDDPVVIVGAGIAGLSCARELARLGLPVRVLDRAKGVGGRCTTRRVEGIGFDLGPAFVHGRDPAFIQAVREAPLRPVEGWPVAVQGTGRPCQPEAFQPGEVRFAVAEGMSAFPKHLATGLDVRLSSRLTRLEVGRGRIRLLLEEGEPVEASRVVLALAPEQVGEVLDATPGLARPLASVRALLATASSEPCLTLAAVYPAGTPPPPWHAVYPEGSRAIQIVVSESSKRGGSHAPGLLYQARAGWSHQHLLDLRWPELMLAEAGRLLGDWAAAPAATYVHRWRYARSGLAAELAGPVQVRLDGGGTVGFCGDRFAPGGGLEAAWVSGRELARRIASKEGA